MNKSKDGNTTTPTKKKPSMTKNVRETDANLGLGAVSLVHKRLTSLEGLGVQKGLVKLYLQNNCLENFEFLNCQPHLKELYAQDNLISSFKGLEAQPKLEIFCISGNPICEQPLYRVMALLAIGNNLRRIDNEMVTTVERMSASRFGPKAAQAVRLGAIVDYKRRSDADFDEIIQQLSLKPESPAKLNLSPIPVKRTPPPQYSTLQPNGPKIEIIFKSKPKHPSDDDDSQEELILRALKQIEDADLDDEIFPVSESALAAALAPPVEESFASRTQSANTNTSSLDQHDTQLQHEAHEGNGNDSVDNSIQSEPEKVKSPRELELEDLHEKVRQLEKNLSEEKKLRIELQALLKQEHTARVKTETLLNAEQEKSNALAQHLTSSMKRSEETSQELADTSQKLSDTTQALADVTQQHNDTVQKYNELSTQCDELMHAHDELHVSYNEMHDKYEALSQEYNNLHETNTQLHEEKLELMAVSTENLLSEKKQRMIIEDKYDRATTPTLSRNSPVKAPAKSGETEFISAKDMCRIDTIQFYTVFRKDSQNISACISFHDAGITMMNTDTSQTMEFPLKTSTQIVKDSDTLMTIFGSNHNVVLNDKRIDLIATLVTHWLKYKN